MEDLSARIKCSVMKGLRSETDKLIKWCRRTITIIYEGFDVSSRLNEKDLTAYYDYRGYYSKSCVDNIIKRKNRSVEP